jgi:hypothetical protein
MKKVSVLPETAEHIRLEQEVLSSPFTKSGGALVIDKSFKNEAPNDFITAAIKFQLEWAEVIARWPIGSRFTLSMTGDRGAYFEDDTRYSFGAFKGVDREGESFTVSNIELGKMNLGVFKRKLRAALRESSMLVGVDPDATGPVVESSPAVTGTSHQQAPIRHVVLDESFVNAVNPELVDAAVETIAACEARISAWPKDSRCGFARGPTRARKQPRSRSKESFRTRARARRSRVSSISSSAPVRRTSKRISRTRSSEYLAWRRICKADCGTGHLSLLLPHNSG